MILRSYHVALTTLIIAGFSAQPALAQPVNTSQGDIGLQVYLVEDKTIAGADFNFAFQNLGFHLEMGIISADDDAPRHNIDDNWIGSLLGIHIFGRVPLSPTLETRIGTGLDSWLLHGIAAGENKYGMPAYGEIRFMPSHQAVVFLRGRYYLFHSDGLGVGEDYQGRRHEDILFSAGVSYAF